METISSVHATTSAEQDTKTESKSQTCHLLDLPPELRNHIYNAVLTFDGPVNVEAPNRSKGAVRVDHISSVASLVSTCRQIYNEASQLFYLNNVFRMDCSASVRPWMDALNWWQYVKHFLSRANVQKSVAPQILTVSLGARYAADVDDSSLGLYLNTFKQLKILVEEYKTWNIYGEIVLLIDEQLGLGDCAAKIVIHVDLREPSAAIEDAIETCTRYREHGTTTEAGVSLEADDLHLDDFIEAINLLEHLAKALSGAKALQQLDQGS